MTCRYFHWAHPEGLLLERRGNDAEDRREVRARAAEMILARLEQPDTDDWRDWSISDDDEELFLTSFAAMLGRPH
jgi:hypothetical protein